MARFKGYDHRENFSAWTPHLNHAPASVRAPRSDFGLAQPDVSRGSSLSSSLNLQVITVALFQGGLLWMQDNGFNTMYHSVRSLHDAFPPLGDARHAASPGSTRSAHGFRTGDSGGGARPSTSARPAKKVLFTPSYADAIASAE
jgi:hypothetical protein